MLFAIICSQLKFGHLTASKNDNNYFLSFKDNHFSIFGTKDGEIIFLDSLPNLRMLETKKKIFWGAATAKEINNFHFPTQSTKSWNCRFSLIWSLCWAKTKMNCLSKNSNSTQQQLNGMIPLSSNSTSFQSKNMETVAFNQKSWGFGIHVRSNICGKRKEKCERLIVDRRQWWRQWSWKWWRMNVGFAANHPGVDFSLFWCSFWLWSLIFFGARFFF